MTRFFFIALALCTALATAGCGQMPFSKTASDNPAHASGQTAGNAPGVGYASDNQSCSGIAKNRLSLYDKPDTFPVSDQERQDAYQALYSSCMRDHNWQVASPAHRKPANTEFAGNASQLANLSPAAGGNAPRPASNATTTTAGGTLVSSATVGGATVLVIGGSKESNALQLSSLSPSSGGGASGTPTVVMLQGQNPSPVPVSYTVNNSYNTPKPALPVAMPVPPLATGYASSPHATLALPPEQPARKHIALRPAHASTTTGAASINSAPQVVYLSPERQLENVLEK